MHCGTCQWPGQKKLFCFDQFIQHMVQAAKNNNDDDDDDDDDDDINNNNNICKAYFP